MKIKCPKCGESFEAAESLSAELNAAAKDKIKKTLASERDKIRLAIEQESERKLIALRREEMEKAEERHRLEKETLEEALAQTRKSLDEAKARSALGTGQQRGEALELDLEEQLRQTFVVDEIAEVRKGVAGADISQVVKNESLSACGTIIYECKNAHWKKAWIDKLKSDVRAASAGIGILVATERPENFSEIEQIENHIWVTSPLLAVPLAGVLRNQLLAVAKVNANTELKDKKMEYLYRFLVSPEFRSRIESLVDGYNKLQTELEKEMRAAKTRWAHQSKAIRQMVDSTFGMYGDFQGLLGGELKALPDSLGEKRGIENITVEDFFEEIEK